MSKAVSIDLPTHKESQNDRHLVFCFTTITTDANLNDCHDFRSIFSGLIGSITNVDVCHIASLEYQVKNLPGVKPSWSGYVLMNLDTSIKFLKSLTVAHGKLEFTSTLVSPPLHPPHGWR